MATARPHKLSKYWALVQLSMVQGLKNYKVLIGQCIFLTACLVIFAHLWRLATAKSGTVFSADQLLWYIAFNEWVLISLPDIYNSMEQELRTGRLAYLLPRPISYLGAKFSEGLGTLLLHLAILGPLTFFLTWLWTDTIPFSLSTFLISVALGLLAGCVGIIFQMIVGLSAFWLQEVSPVYWMWEKFLFVFGGIILPLTTYPLWMQKIAAWTPFPPILGERSTLAIQYDATHTIALIGSLFLWGVIGYFFLYLIYQRGLRILNIEGG